MKRLVLAAFVLALAVPAQASADRFAIGIQKGADERAVAREVQAATGEPVTKIGPFALSVRAHHARRAALAQRHVLGRAHAGDAAARVHAQRPADQPAVVPGPDPRLRRLGAGCPRSRTCASPCSTPASTRATRTSQGQIADGRSFVSSSWETDTNGHGTFVAGEIAAATNNGTGIAAVGFPVELLIAKIVRADGTISPDAEARAIHWAVDQGARVINMSFGGVRDPHDPGLDTYSPLEAAAVQYAVSKGVLVVAAVGNARQRSERAVELRRLSRSPPARPRRQLAEPRRNGAELLEPRLPLRRHRGSRRGHLLDAPARADPVVQARLSASGLLGLRPDGVPPR